MTSGRMSGTPSASSSSTLARELPLQPPVRRERGRQLVEADVRPAVGKQQPAALDVGRDRDEHTLGHPRASSP